MAFGLKITRGTDMCISCAKVDWLPADNAAMKKSRGKILVEQFTVPITHSSQSRRSAVGSVLVTPNL